MSAALCYDANRAKCDQWKAGSIYEICSHDRTGCSNHRKKYMECYNNHEDGCWKYDKACKRIHQMVTIEDSLCLIQMEQAEITGKHLAE